MLLIEKVLAEQGRKKVWLAAQLEVSPSQITRLFNGSRLWSGGLKGLAVKAVGWSGEAERLFEPVEGWRAARLAQLVEDAKVAAAAGHITAKELDMVREIFDDRAAAASLQTQAGGA